MTVWLGDYDVARMTSRIPHPYSEGDAEDFLALTVEHRFVIQRKSDVTERMHREQTAEHLIRFAAAGLNAP